MHTTLPEKTSPRPSGEQVKESIFWPEEFTQEHKELDAYAWIDLTHFVSIRVIIFIYQLVAFEVLPLLWVDFLFGWQHTYGHNTTMKTFNNRKSFVLFKHLLHLFYLNICEVLLLIIFGNVFDIYF